MPKLVQHLYMSIKTGEKRLNCYSITIPKEIVNQTDLEGKELKVSVKDNKIIIEKR